MLTQYTLCPTLKLDVMSHAVECVFQVENLFFLVFDCFHVSSSLLLDILYSYIFQVVKWMPNAVKSL